MYLNVDRAYKSFEHDFSKERNELEVERRDGSSLDRLGLGDFGKARTRILQPSLGSDSIGLESKLASFIESDRAQIFNGPGIRMK